MFKTIFMATLLMMSFSSAQASCGDLDSDKLLEQIVSVEQLFSSVLNRTPYLKQNELQSQLARTSAELSATGTRTQRVLECLERNKIIIGYQAPVVDEFADIDQLATLRERIVVRDSALIGSRREDILLDSIKILQSARKTLAKIENANLGE